MKRLLLSFLVFCFVLVASNARVGALSSTVAPAFVRLSVSNEKQQDSASVALTNNDSQAVTYSVTIVDVDVATGSLLPKNTTSELTKKLLTVDPGLVTLQGGSSINIKITANNFDKLTPGGHYAALKIEPQLQTIKRADSNIQQAVSVPVFVVKQDGAKRSLTARTNILRSIYIGSLPKLSVTLKNTGNVDVIPYGFVSFIAGTSTLSKQPINEFSRPLFAEQEQVYDLAKPDTYPQFVKKLSVVTSFRAGEGENQQILQHDIWFVPLWTIFAVLGMFASVWFGIKRLRHRSKKVKVTSQIETRKTRTTRAKKLAQKQNNQSTQKKKQIVSDFGSTKGIK